jgi:hypothetical protein
LAKFETIRLSKFENNPEEIEIFGITKLSENLTKIFAKLNIVKKYFKVIVFFKYCIIFLPFLICVINYKIH